MEYGYTPSTSSYAPYPVKVLASFLHFSDDDGNSRLVPMYENKGSGDWGDHAPIEEDGTLYPMPGYVWLRWWSIPEQRCYGTDLYLRPSRLAELWKEHETGREPERYKYFVFGLSPYGGVAVWMKAQRKSVLLKWTYAEADDALQGHERALLERLQMLKEPVALPPKAYFDQNMQQYTYRYVALEDYWDGRAWQPYDDDSDEMFCDRMEELLFDGTRDQLGSEYLFGYHRGGVPRCLSAIWYHGRNEYRLCFWLDREAVMQAVNLLEHCSNRFTAASPKPVPTSSSAST